MMRSPRVVGVAAVATAALCLSGVTPAAAQPGPASQPTSGGTVAPAATGLPGAADTKKVTLITGDEVSLTRIKDPSGRTSITTQIEPAKRPGGAEVSFAQWGTADEYYVVPSDVLDLVGSRVDKRIFDVAGLIDSGANESPETRVIVSFKGAASGLEAAANAVSAKANATDSTVLPSADAVAMRVPAGKARGLFDQLETASSQEAYVSLDGRVKALDTTSMPQIGATQAWKSGYTGKGVKVAVLDTGIDATHPDLKGKVTASKNFTKSTTATDRYGHGTHVASIIAGSGAASDRSMRGVAYQAKLLNAKVLNDDGRGYDSDIIKGMEWAAKSGAKVINMSLGGGPSDGTDPMEKSVNALSKQYGVLFAIAAGNGGQFGPGGVSTPSTADAALSVAAVDSKNKIAYFSDSGPREGDSALKPDVAAPGVDILGARSKVNVWGSGSSPYVKLSGTSMATPHVAGAAAVLAQARPKLTGNQLKTALMGGATDRSGSVWQEGTGVINIPGAINTPVIANEGSLSYGVFSYPQSNLKPRVKTLHYKNTTSKAITIKLKSSATSAKGKAAAGIKLSKTTVQIPAKSWVKVYVTVTPGANPVGQYAGAVTATPSTGHKIRTTLGWINDVQRFNVRITLRDRAGKLGKGTTSVANVNNAGAYNESVNITERATLRLPRGTYYAASLIVAQNSKPGDRDVVLGVNGQFVVNGNVSMTLGGSSARRISVKTPRPSRIVSSSYVYTRADAVNRNTFIFNIGDGDPARTWVASTSSAAVTSGTANFAEQALLAGPGSRPSYDYRVGYVTKNRIPASFAHTVSSRQVATVVGNYRAQTSGAEARVGWYPYLEGAGVTYVHRRSVALPATVKTYLVASSPWWANTVDGPVGKGYQGDNWSYSPFQQYSPGSSTRIQFLTGIMSPGAVSDGAAFRDSSKIVVALPLFEDSEGKGTRSLVAPTTTTLTAYAGSKKLASGTSTDLSFGVPAGNSVKVVQRVNRSAPWWKTSTTSIGEWTAPIPSRSGELLRLMNAQYRVPQTLGGYVPAGKQSIDLTVTQHTDPSNSRGSVIKPKSLTLDWSDDGGKTWKAAAMVTSGSQAMAVFWPPKRSTPTNISLRTRASDGKGSTVKETIISAYRMGASK